MNIYSIFPFLGSVIMLFLSIFVFLKKQNSNINRGLSFFAFVSFIWLFLYAFAYSISDKEQIFLLLKFGFTGVMLFPPAFSFFVFAFLDVKYYKRIIFIYFILSSVFIYLLWGTSSIFTDLHKYFWGYYPLAGSLHPYFLTYFIISVIIAQTLLFLELVKLKKQKSFYKYRVLYVFIGFLLYSVASVDFISNYRIEVYPFGWVFAIFFVSIITYAIVRYQLMDIRLVIQKAFFYSVGVALATGLIVGVSFLSSWFTERIPGFQSWIVPLIAGTTAFMVGRIFWHKSKEVDKLKYEFITVAAHKLRTPLTKVKWALEALSEEVPEAGKKLIFEANKANTQTIELTDELLVVSKADADKIKYQLKPADLEMITQDVINDLEDQIKTKNIKLMFNYEKNLPQVNVDKLRISSVVQILLENAILYTKDEIKINIDSHKDSVLFHIEDNGIGIKKEDQPYIFSRFYRSHEAYLTETEGTGIGLFLAKNMIDKHDGTIGVRSEGKGKGSIFWFKLPVV